MSNTVVYSRPFCPFCVKAELLLKEKGYAFTKIDLSREPDRMEEMLAISEGVTSVPQIVLDGVYVGGFDQLEAILGDCDVGED